VDRRFYLAIGLIVMSFNSLYQYSWNVFEPLLVSGFDTRLLEIQVAFTLFAIFSTVSQGPGGYIADRYGPRRIGIIAAILSASGFLGTSFLHDLTSFYVLWSLGSVGEGILYGIATNLAVKWFVGSRGIAVGTISLGFGVGASVANVFIVRFGEFRTPMLIIGLLEIIILPILMSLTRYPEQSTISGRTPFATITDGRYWILYVSFVLGSIPLIVIASSFGFIGKSLPLYEFIILISIFPLLSGISRPILGYISDFIGRTKTLIIIDISIIVGALFLVLRIFPVSIVLIGFFGGSMISMYFALIGDVFGSKFSTSNNGIFYTGKAISGFLGSAVFALIFVISIEISFNFVLVSSILALVFLLLSVPRQARDTSDTNGS
jgi:OFA family oxalate/formate antiporter-like MFS transporter